MPPPPAEARAGPRSGAALRLTRDDFARLSTFIQDHCGIRMPPAKRTLLESRLRARVVALGLTSFAEYCDHVLGGDAADELVHMVDRVTTNKTDFFRERQHFEVLVRRAVPALAARDGAGEQRPLRVWSAGCSTGEEPYTLAMVLAEAGAPGRPLRFEILATDLSTRALRRAERGVYQDAQVEPVPLALRRRYLQRSRADASVVRVLPALRARVRFRRLNLLDDDPGVHPPLDVIFCRNVFIYFERATQQAILRRFARILAPGGFLFLGHAETTSGLDVPFEQLAPTVYRLRAGS